MGRAAEFVRPYLIAMKEKVSFTSQLAAWVLERIYDLLVALLIFGFALSQAKHSAISVGPTLRWVFEAGGYIVVVACVCCLAVLALFGRFSHRTIPTWRFACENPHDLSGAGLCIFRARARQRSRKTPFGPHGLRIDDL